MLPTKDTNKKIMVCAPESYPEIAVEKKDPRWVSMLMQDLCASKSEMTAINQYLYQSWVLNQNYQEIKDTILRIAKVEMHHLQILGEVIALLGGDPKYIIAINNQFCQPWNGRMVAYQQNIRQMIALNIAAEEDAMNTYLYQAEQIKDFHISALLNRMSEDEKIHRDIFMNFLKLTEC